MKTCRECGGHYWDTPDGRKVTFEQLMKIEVYFLRGKLREVGVYTDESNIEDYDEIGTKIE